MVQLFRLVQEAERNDILTTGQLRTAANTMEGKLFWLTHADALRFARMLGEKPSWVVSVVVDADPSDPRLQKEWNR